MAFKNDITLYNTEEGMISVNMVAGIRKVVHMSVQRTSIHVTLSMTTATDVQQPTGEVLSLRMLTTQAVSLQIRAIRCR